MTLSEVVSITGLPGLYKAGAKRNDGLIVTSLVDGQTKFVSGRQHLFSTLDNITVYTTGDNRELKEIFAAMKKMEKKDAPTNLKTDEELKAYFGKVVPDYDKEKVYVSHIKKMVSWYNILNGKNLIEELIADEKKEVAAEGTEKPEKEKAAKEDKPKKEAKPKATAATKTKATAKPSGAVKKITTPRKAS
ncbi:MAG: DUF5606 domain-containing protein [Chitinophagales bacterium]